LIPESAERGALGVIGEHGSDTKRCFERFLEKKHLEPLEWQGARIPVYRGWVPVRRQIGTAKFIWWVTRLPGQSLNCRGNRDRFSRRARRLAGTFAERQEPGAYGIAA